MSAKQLGLGDAPNVNIFPVQKLYPSLVQWFLPFVKKQRPNLPILSSYKLLKTN